MAPPPAFVAFEGGVHEIGHRGRLQLRQRGPVHRRFLEPFALADRLVTNGEYLAFMADGGYARPELWMSAGWAARELHGWTEPFYWERRDGAWWTLHPGGDATRAPGRAGGALNWYEADAFARWAGARLPREDEWEVAARAALEAGAPLDGNLADTGRLPPSGGPARQRGGGPREPAPALRRRVGVDGERLRGLSRGTARPPAPWGSTTGSS
jgi:formylglycine-generating enzyme required for sulfatase activity